MLVYSAAFLSKALRSVRYWSACREVSSGRKSISWALGSLEAKKTGPDMPDAKRFHPLKTQATHDGSDQWIVRIRRLDQVVYRK